MKKRKNKKNINKILILVVSLFLITYSYHINNFNITKQSIASANNIQNVVNIENSLNSENIYIDLSSIPEYSSSPYIEINNNIPYFTETDLTTEVFEKYSDWDSLGRSGVAFANICKETMPKEGEKRGEIGMIKDLSGWIQKRYDNVIKDKYLYNRCHLIGWELGSENDNKLNLITGTRYLNVEGMLPFENLVANYIRYHQDNHVLYRVTPIYDGDNKLASGVEMEAYSVEDKGQSICFNVYCYNVQPGIEIDYATGNSHEAK